MDPTDDSTTSLFELGPALKFDPDKENWVEIFATNVNLRLMFNPQDGLLVDGGQADFEISTAAGRWYMNNWVDLPRP